VALPLERPADAVAALELFATSPKPGSFRLRKAATEAAILAREEKLGTRLPEELRELLLEHDGLRETLVGSGDYLGGTTTLSGLRRRFRTPWVELAEELGEEVPFRFGRRYFVIGMFGGTGHAFALLDQKRRVEGGHPVLCFDFDDVEAPLTGFPSLTDYLHWVFLVAKGAPARTLEKRFPERYRPAAFKKMLAGAERVT
jgi:hypothetical protein